MTTAERNKARKLQDKIIDKCDRMGITDATRLSEGLPASMTLGNLRQFVYPAYMSDLERILSELSR